MSEGRGLYGLYHTRIILGFVFTFLYFALFHGISFSVAFPAAAACAKLTILKYKILYVYIFYYYSICIELKSNLFTTSIF